MGFLDNFKLYIKQFEVVSKDEGFMIDNEYVIYDIYNSILRDQGCGSNHVIDDEYDMFVYIMEYMRNNRMISILQLMSQYYFIRKLEIEELFSEVRLN